MNNCLHNYENIMSNRISTQILNVIPASCHSHNSYIFVVFSLFICVISLIVLARTLPVIESRNV